MSYQNGQTVTWKSARSGNQLAGKIVFVGKKFNLNHIPYSTQGWISKAARQEFKNASSRFRNTEVRSGIVVQVDRKGSKGQDLKPLFYSPRLTALAANTD